ncbi:hypothetical protein Acsp03_67120 [Actinomadura sp. NBRC 104412]|nr:hypothetical protein Acsp03_67120 [Actinomadura sp. NBRC 104412]
MGSGDASRDDHAPGVGEQFAHLGFVEGGRSGVDPVPALVGKARQVELGGVGGDERVAFLLGEGEAYDRLVGGERDVDDSADAELDPIPDEVLGGAGRLSASRLTSSTVIIEGPPALRACPTWILGVQPG